MYPPKKYNATLYKAFRYLVHTVNLHVKCIHLFATCMFRRLAGQQPSDLPRNSEMIPIAMTYYSV